MINLNFLENLQITQKCFRLFWNNIDKMFEIRNDENVILGIGDTKDEAVKDAEAFLESRC